MQLQSLSLAFSLALLPLATTVLAQAPKIPTGRTLIYNTNSQKCLNDPKSSLVIGTLVQQAPCQDTDNMLWNFVPKPGGVMIKTSVVNLCLAPVKASKTSPSDIELARCDPKKPETIWIINVQGDKFYFLNKYNNLCLGIKDQSTAESAQLVQSNCSQKADQLWSFFRGTAQITNPGTNVPLSPVSTTKPNPVDATPPAPTQPAPTPPAATPAPGAGGGNGVTHTQPLSKTGKWSNKIDLGLSATSMAVLGSGKVLIWAGYAEKFFGGHDVTKMVLFDPGTGQKKPVLTPSVGGVYSVNTSQEYFCEATTILANGGILVSGGSDADRTSIADPNGNWNATSTLNIARGYSASTLTSNGQVFIVGGSWNNTPVDKTGELYTPGTGWRLLKNVPGSAFLTNDVGGQYRSDNHMWLYGSSNGWVFHAGPAKTMHWINTSGDGSVVSAGTRGNDDDAMTGSAAMYDINKILTLGGAPDYNGRPPSNHATLIDISKGPGSGVSTRSIGNMQYARMFGHAIVLPNGQVMIAGGAGPGAAPFTDAGAVLQPELWDPATEKFQPLPPMASPRVYHSIGFLLLDGRVMLAGGQLGAADQSIIRMDAEIYTPPYLLNSDGTDAPRPTITAAPASTTAGQTINVKATGATSFVLVRVTSQSHSVNNDQRRIPLNLAGTNTTKLIKPRNTKADETTPLKIPDDRGIVIPGTYYLFALDDYGTPSIASMMNIQ